MGMKKVFAGIFCTLMFQAGAVYAQNGGLGAVGEHIIKPLGGLIHLMNTLCWVAGAGLLAAAVLQYKNHRDNPSQVRLSTPFLLALVGLVLIALPFLGALTAAAEYISQ